MEGLERERDVVLNYLFRPRELSIEYDWLIIPGTKNVMEDVIWLVRSGWKREIGQFAKRGGDRRHLCPRHPGFPWLKRRLA